MIEFVCLGLSFGIFFFLWKSRMNYLLLGRLPVATSAALPDVTVIIPARNEAHQIANAVASFPGLAVIVVNDGSSDDTAAVAVAAGARVMDAPALKAGCLGKPNACAAGAAVAETKWLLFVDADTAFKPGFAASAVACAEENNYDLLTAFLEQRCVSVCEKMLLPDGFALYFTGVSARAVNRTGSKEALANGQCLLFRRSAYERMGGHGQVMGSVIEDVAIAQAAKRNGLAVRVVRAEHLGSVRMYDSLGAIWKGFQKNSFRFLQVNPVGGVQVILASILLTSWLPALVLGLGDYPKPLTVGALLQPTPVLFLFLAPFLTLLPWYAESKPGRMWRVVLAPFGIYFFQLIALNGMFVTLFRRTTDWKGRRV
jgi:cellulose synthase/poly-beta-1,6-N-acetylglucosamine synthase-like glycosyltransferase